MNYTKAVISEKAEDSFTAVASTETTDRHGEIVKQDGWDLKNYKQNPILLYMHDHTMPLGKATRIWIDKASGKTKLMFKGVISTATDYGKAAKQLMDEGILNTFSVGFRINEMDGNTITKAELHEISLVSVPANPEARRLALKTLQDSGFKEEIIKDFVVEPIDDKDEEISDLKSRVDELTKQVETAVKGLQHLAPQRSKPVIEQRLMLAKAIAKTADKLVVTPHQSTVTRAKIIKRSSEMLIRDLKGNL